MSDTLPLFAELDAPPPPRDGAPPRRVAFSLSGPPVPCERARFGNGGHAFTPAKTRAYQKAVGLAARAARPRNWPLDAQYTLILRVWFPDRRRRDLSNVLKSVEDGCNGVLWADDCAITRILVDGGLDREAPRIEVEVTVR